MASSRPTQAAGGLLWRMHDGGLEVALVHRPHYDDWSLPKGKSHDGELLVRAAVREVGEETGASVAVSRRLGQIHYVANGRAKVVRYWAMRHLHGQFRPGREVDELAWLEPRKAERRLTYDGDRAVLAAAVSSGGLPTSVLVLVRHAKAGKRAEWPANDLLRPLDDVGRRQAQALVGLVGAFSPLRIVSANPLRCIQTVEPLAGILGVAVEVAPAFSDDGFDRDPGATRSSIDALVASGQVTVVCSQGEAIPGIISAFTSTRARKSTTAKGATWVIGCRDAAIVSADYYRAPVDGRRRGGDRPRVRP